MTSLFIALLGGVVLAGIVGCCKFRVDWPDFEEQAAIQTGVACGNLRGFVKVFGEDEPVASDHFLGFAKRTVSYHVLSRNRFAFILEPLPASHFSLINQLIKPGVELVNCALYFIPRQGAIPLTTGNYQVFGRRGSVVHNGLSSKLASTRAQNFACFLKPARLLKGPLFESNPQFDGRSSLACFSGCQNFAVALFYCRDDGKSRNSRGAAQFTRAGRKDRAGQSARRNIVDSGEPEKEDGKHCPVARHCRFQNPKKITERVDENQKDCPRAENASHLQVHSPRSVDQTMRVLVVEDETKIAAVLRKALAEAGCVVEALFRGDEALAALRETPYDVAVLDIMLPGLDGLTVLRRLRAEANPVPILLLTARGDVSDRVEGLELGADDYLAKPFSVEEFVARVRVLLRRRSRDPQTTYKVGDLSMDLVRRQVQRAGRRIELTVREFSLLELLLRSPGHVFTRTQICEKVWNYHFDPGTNLVDVYVQRLRRKVDDDSCPRLIHTIRGVGYCVSQTLP
jgi:two-component system, OmpR family, response regulator